VCANEPADGAIRDAWLTLEHWLATVAEARPTDDDNQHIVVNNVVTADIDYTALRECIADILEEYGEQTFTKKSLRKLFRDVLKKHAYAGPPGPTGAMGDKGDKGLPGDPDALRLIVREELHRAMHTPLEDVGLVKAAPHNQD
jgi:hypothetical protein